jgi:hypothetical protein
MTVDGFRRAPREVLRTLLPPNQVVAVLDAEGAVIGQLSVVACSAGDVEVRTQRGDITDGPISVRVGANGVGWDLNGLYIRTTDGRALLANLVLVRRVQQRAWVRVPLLSTIELLDHENRRWELEGIDLSAGGLAARCHEPPPPRGFATFAITMPGSVTTLKLSVEAVRARCLPDGRWRAAYRFDRVDPATHSRLVALVTRLTARTGLSVD